MVACLRCGAENKNWVACESLSWGWQKQRQKSELSASRVVGKGLLLYREGGPGLWVHGRFWGCVERLVSIVIFVWFYIMLVGNTTLFPTHPYFFLSSALYLSSSCICTHGICMHMHSQFTRSCLFPARPECSRRGRQFTVVQYERYQNRDVCKALW